MEACVAEDDLLELVRGQRPLGDTPSIEAHLADCPACSALVATLLLGPKSDEPTPRRDMAGRSLGPYRLDVLIGAGAMGEVYRAWDERLDRHVAVKVISQRVAASPEQVRRLEAEGRAAAAIRHPNVVTVYDVGSADGVPFIVSELIDGESLRSRIDRGPIPHRAALKLGLDLARGLSAAHAQGVVHRDLKPHNLIVAEDGALQILDFGLAKLTREQGREIDATERGAVLGTSGYLSPEQARGEPADRRSDIFAVGAILYEMLTGERAFGGATFAERLSSVLRDTPPRLNDATLGDAAPVVARCLEKEPKLRFQAAEDLAWVLEGLIERPAAPPPKRGIPDEAPPSRARIARRTFLLGTAAAGAAGTLLGRFVIPGRAPASATSPPSYQALTYRHGRVTTARFTRDGGSILYGAAWDGLPLAIFTMRFGGGGVRPLDLPSADLLAVSSRGEIAISIGHRFIEGLHACGRLALAPLEGGEPHVIAPDVQEADFTPDGRELSIVRRGGKGFRLELPIGRALLEDEWVSHPRVSPDGATVACLVHPSLDDDRGEVVLVDRATGARRVLSSGWSSVAGLAWSPGGRELWFAAAREGANSGIHAVSIDGRETFTAETTGRLRVHDVAADGRVAVSHDNWRLRMMVRPPGASGDVDLSLSDVSAVTDMSADGRSIVFAEFGDVESASGCYRRSTLGGAPLRLGDGAPVSLSGDGERVLAVLFGVPARVLVYSMGAEPQRALSLGPIEAVEWARFAGADRIVVCGSAAGRPRRLWVVGGEATAPAPITDEGVSGHGRVSPDGSRVAFVAEDGRLLVVPALAASAVKVVPGDHSGGLVCGFRRGGAEVFMRNKGTPIRIQRVDVATGDAALEMEIAPPALGLRGVDSVVLSALGDAYAYSYGQELSRLYVMKARSPV